MNQVKNFLEWHMFIRKIAHEAGKGRPKLKYGYTRVYPNSDGFVPYPGIFGRVIPVSSLLGYTRVYPYFSPGLPAWPDQF